jgi:opacity protein-like surface antigen
MRIALIGVLISVMAAASAFAADATGVWKGEVKLPTGQVLPFVARLTQDGAKITGKLDGIGGTPDVEVVDGKVEKDVITFSGVRQINADAVRFNYTATFKDADTLEFRIVRADGSAPPLSSVTTRSADK